MDLSPTLPTTHLPETMIGEMWPPTAATLATLSMETLPGLVGVMEHGVGHLQGVSVSGMDFELLVFIVLIIIQRY